MAYSGSAMLMEFQMPSEIAAVASSILDISASSADVATIICPMPLLVYQFGLQVTEAPATLATGAVLLERSTVPAAAQATVATIELDSTSLLRGDGVSAAQTALALSSDLSVGDVIWSANTSFPIVIEAPQVLTLSFTQTSIVGEFRAFIMARWLPIEYHSSEIWTNMIN